MQRHWWVWILLGVITLTGCGGAKAPADSADPQPAAAETESGGVVVGVRISRSTLKPGESADLTIWAENRGTTASIYQGCGPGVHLSIEGPNGARLQAEPKVGGRGYCAAIMDAELLPGQRLEETFTLRVPEYPAAEPVPGGPYVVKASYARGPVRNPPPRLESEITVQVGEGEQTISREQATQKAKADPRVAQWLRAHSGTGLVRQDSDGQWWINFGDYFGERGQGMERDETGIWGRATAEVVRDLEHDPRGAAPSGTAAGS